MLPWVSNIMPSSIPSFCLWSSSALCNTSRVMSFLSSSISPSRGELIALCVGRPKKAAGFAAICTLASVLGGVLGYGIGVFASDVGQSIIAFFGEQYLDQTAHIKTSG